MSCEKEETDTIPQVNTSNKSVNKKTDFNDKSDNGVTYILEDNFESEFEIFAQNFFTTYPYGMIEITHLPESAQYALTTEDEGPIDPITSDRIVCKGEKSNVMNCAARFTQFNIFGCYATVTSGANNTWLATEICG